MDFKTRTREEMEKVLRPIDSLIGKSEKAQGKLTPGTWQHTMLEGNLKALRIAFRLMSGEAGDPEEFSPDDLKEALESMDSMIKRSEKAWGKFSPGTSQYTLQKNRIHALRIASELISGVLEAP
mgnify:FL=1